MKAEIKEAAQEKPEQPIKELAESSGPRTEMEKTERGKRKNGDATTSRACRSASKATATLAASQAMEVIIFPPTNDCFHLTLKLHA